MIPVSAPALSQDLLGAEYDSATLADHLSAAELTPTEHLLLKRLGGEDVQSLDDAMEPLRKRIIPDAEARVGYIYDFQANAIVGGGESAARLFGYRLHEIMALPGTWGAIIVQDDLDRLREVFWEVAEGRSEIGSQQTRIRCRNGSLAWIQHDWRAMSRNENGQMLRMLGLVQVVTQLARKQLALFNEAALDSLGRMLVGEWTEGIYLLEDQFRVLYANGGALGRLGCSQEEVYRRSFDDIITCDGGRRLSKQIPRTGQKVTMRALHQQFSAPPLPVEVTLRNVGSERFLATTRDISTQVALEEADRRETAYYKALFVNNPSGVAVFDADFTITDANPALRNMVGYTEKSLKHRPLADLFDPQYRARLREWAKSGGSKARASYECEVVLRKRDGRPLHAHAAVTVVAGGNSDFHGLIILTDLTARREAEIALAREAEVNDKLIRESAALIAMLDGEGRFVQVNPAVERLSGYAARELLGKIAWETPLLDEEEKARAIERFTKLVAGEARTTSLTRVRSKTGADLILDEHDTVVRREDGSIDCIIVTAVDLTEQYRLQRHLMEAVEQEQARIGHDLHDGVGQILTGIGAMVEMLGVGLSGADREEAQRIHSLVGQAIQQVRQLSRNMSPTAVQNRDLSASLILLADMVRTSFRRNCECELESRIRITDPTMASHLFRIAQEAINNAIRHGNPQRILLRLGCQDAGHALLEIINDGSSFDCRPGSEGIGLRVMRYRASLIHAEFAVTCPPTGGVTVSCRFPFATLKNHPKTKNIDTNREKQSIYPR